MKSQSPKITWAPRVERNKIARLYEKLAAGIFDDDLIDEVAYAFYARCESIIEATEAWHGRVKCRGCGVIIHLKVPPRQLSGLKLAIHSWPPL